MAPAEPVNDLGWVIDPHGFYHDKSGRPTMVLPGTTRVIGELV